MNKSKKLQLKCNLITVFVLFTILFTGSVAISSNAAIAEAVPPQATTSTSSQTTTNSVSTTDESIPEKNASELEHFSKKGMQNGFVKFGFAMLGVLLSAIVIFFALKLYKKLGGKVVSAPDTFGVKNSLDSPSEMKDAINLFLDKTDN